MKLTPYLFLLPYKECRRSASYYKHPEKRSGSPVTFALSSQDRNALIFQPNISVSLNPTSPSNQHALRLISLQIAKHGMRSDADREKVGRIMTEFLVPFFNFPVHWVLDEARASFRGKLSSTVVKCKHLFFFLVCT